MSGGERETVAPEKLPVQRAKFVAFLKALRNQNGPFGATDEFIEQLADAYAIAAPETERAREALEALDRLVEAARQVASSTVGHVGVAVDADTVRAALGATAARSEGRELLCMLCGQEYPCWYAPNELWNPVMRLPDGSDRWPFVCPTCFAQKAEDAGIATIFELRTPSLPVAPSEESEK